MDDNVRAPVRRDSAHVATAASRRIEAQAPRRRPRSFTVCDELVQREIAGGALSRSSVRARFGNFTCQSRLDVASGAASRDDELAILRRRSRVVEVVATDDLVVGLAHNGVCVAFKRPFTCAVPDTSARVALNVQPDEVVRSIFLNQPTAALISVSVYASDGFSSLRCRATPLDALRRGRLPDTAAVTLFKEQPLVWPGFVELDDTSHVALTYSQQARMFHVYDLTTSSYTLLFSVDDAQIQDARVSPGTLMLVHVPQEEHILLTFRALKSGHVAGTMRIASEEGRKLEFLELWGDAVFIKQEHAWLRIVDVRTGATREVPDFETPSAFIFLHDALRFLAVHGPVVSLYNCRGEVVTRFADHRLWQSDGSTNNVFVTANQKAIISHCRPNDESVSPHVGAVHVSDIATGRCLERICATVAGDDTATAQRTAALRDVTAIFYDEKRAELLTGGRSGHVSVWTSTGGGGAAAGQ